MDLVQSMLALVPAQYVVYLAAALGLAAIADANLPVPAAGSAWVTPRRVLHAVAQNYRYAANAVPAGTVPASTAASAAELRTVAEDVEKAAGKLVANAEGQAEAVAAPAEKG